MSRSTVIAKKIYIPDDVALSLHIIPSTNVNKEVIRRFNDENKRLDPRKLKYMVYEIDTFHGWEMADFIRDNTTDGWSSGWEWEFDDGDAKRLLEEADRKLKTLKEEDNYYEDYLRLKEVIEKELEAGLEWFYVWIY